MYIKLNKMHIDNNLSYMLKDKFDTYEVVCFVSGYQNPSKIGFISVPKDTDILALEETLNARI